MKTNKGVPAVSVVIPLFNKEKYIARTLKSVLSQSFTDYEIIVVDDGSTDRGPEIVQRQAEKEPRLVYLQQENAGPAQARNLGIKHARANLIAFLDADDEWMPDFLLHHVRLAAAYPQAGLIASNYKVIHGPGRERVAVPPEVLPRGFREGIVKRPFDLWRKSFFVCSSAVLVRNAVFKNVGGFNPQLRVAEDSNLWARIMLQWPVVFSTRVLAIYHKDVDSSISRSWIDMQTPPEFCFARKYMPLSDRRKNPENAQDFAIYKRESLESYLTFWSAAGRWSHARRVAKQEGVSLARVLWDTKAFLKPWFYSMNLRRLLVKAGIIKAKTS